MLIDDDGRIARNIPGNFLLSLLINKTSKASHINIVPIRHVGFNNTKECFYRCRNICFVDAGLFCDLVNDVCFGHGDKILMALQKIQDGKFKCRMFKCKMKLLIITTMGSIAAIVLFLFRGNYYDFKNLTRLLQNESFLLFEKNNFMVS